VLGLVDDRASTSRPLLQHVDDWQADLENKDNTITHCKLITNRVRRLLQGCRFTFYGDIDAAAVAAWLAQRRRDGLSVQSSNFYLQNAKQFCKWMVRAGRASSNPLDHLQALNVRTDRRHDRRALSVAEVEYLIEAAECGDSIRGMPGPERALCYRLMLATGLRVGEVASLRRESFRLDTDPATVTVLAGSAKNRREAVQPLQDDVAQDMRSLLAATPAGEGVFSIPKHRPMSELIAADLEAARSRWIEEAPPGAERQGRELDDFCRYCDSAGRYADAHSLRHTFASRLAGVGVPIRVAMALLRHSDINLTMNLYSHIDGEQEADAILKLPSYGKKADESKPGAVAEGEA